MRIGLSTSLKTAAPAPAFGLFAGDTTSLSQIITPEIFLPYMVQRTAELTALYTSGIINVDPEFVALANGGGRIINMPFWDDLQGDEEVIIDGSSLTTKNITTGKDAAILHMRADAWKVNDLAKKYSAEDPMRAIADLVAGYRARKRQHMLVSLLTGVYGSGTMTNAINVINSPDGNNITTANYLTGDTFLDTKQLLGDNKEKLVAIAMHSRTETALLKQDLIDFIPVTDGREQLKTFQGLQVIVDDGCPVQTIGGHEVYTTYLFGKGAIAMGESTNDEPIEGGFGSWRLEYGRDPLAGESIMIIRSRFLFHPRGVKYTDASTAAEAPTNPELAMAANWSRVYEQKNVRLVAVQHNLPGR